MGHLRPLLGSDELDRLAKGRGQIASVAVVDIDGCLPHVAIHRGLDACRLLGSAVLIPDRNGDERNQQPERQSDLGGHLSFEPAELQPVAARNPGHEHAVDQHRQ